MAKRRTRVFRKIHWKKVLDRALPLVLGRMPPGNTERFRSSIRGRASKTKAAISVPGRAATIPSIALTFRCFDLDDLWDGMVDGLVDEGLNDVMEELWGSGSELRPPK